MKPAKRYLLGYWVLLLAIILRIAFLIIYYIFLRYYTGTMDSRISWRVIGYTNFFSIVIMAAEMIVYWYRRHYIPNKTWVHIHVWSVFLAVIVLRVVTSVLVYILLRKQSEGEYFDITDFHLIIDIQEYTFWGLIIIGHIFFIATIVRSLALQKERESNDNSGLLDEFIDKP